jgi:homoserine dehydrogenase
VGKAFLSQLTSIATRLSQTKHNQTYLSLVLLARSSKALFSPNYAPIPLSSWSDALAASTLAVPPLSEMAEYLSGAPGPVVLVDNTSDIKVAESYPDFLAKGISVVTPNKKGFSADAGLWDRIFAAAANGSGTGSGFVFHESTVGAGLPVLSTLHELVETGDKVRRVEGVFSGTMSYLFNTWNPTDPGSGEAQPFSACVAKARELGYTEPDPRDDLNGMDVARKCTILARLAGLKVQDATSFPTQSLVPKELEAAASAEEYLEGMKQFDGEMESLKADAAKEGKVVRFVGSVDVLGGNVKVGLEKFDKSHPIAALKGSDNIISFYTERYGDNPLIIQGAG